METVKVFLNNHILHTGFSSETILFKFQSCPWAAATWQHGCTQSICSLWYSGSLFGFTCTVCTSCKKLLTLMELLLYWLNCTLEAGHLNCFFSVLYKLHKAPSNLAVVKGYYFCDNNRVLPFWRLFMQNCRWLFRLDVLFCVGDSWKIHV